MKQAKWIDVESNKGAIVLHDAEYVITQSNMVKITWEHGVNDADIERLHGIVKMQMQTQRSFVRNRDTYTIEFEVPFSVVNSLIV